MPRDFSRSSRVAEQIQRELAELIRLEIKDPRVGDVTVSEVDLAPDLRRADVLVTRLGADADGSRQTVDGLNRAAGFLRGRLARRLRLRSVPTLHFRYDPSFERGARLSQLIDQAVGRDGGGDEDR